MRMRVRRAAVRAVLGILLAATLAAAAEPVRYELRFEKPQTHLLEITVRATGLRGPAVEFAIPAWAPGHYVINDYAKNVQEFRAAGPDGQPLAWRKTDKQTWRIEIGRTTAVTVRYKLYGNTLANGWVQYNDRHAAIAGPAAWMYLVGGKERPVELVMDPPAGWNVATGLGRAAENTFTATDYDTFIDAPIEISDFAERTFTHAGSTYHVVVHDVLGRKDFAKFTADTQKLVAAMVEMFRPVVGVPRAAPFGEYWFLFHVWPGTRGGLEHLNSTQINFANDWDSMQMRSPNRTDYELKLAVTAHEFFHSWNVKRLRPKPLGPFDYSREVHTPSLWISEGLTSYYAFLAMARAGVITPEKYLDWIGQLLTAFERQPGRRERSIEETSWDTWFRATGGDGETNLANTTYSYYDGGQIAGHLLDFAIRQATANQKSLDDWMRLLYQRHALPKPGFDPEDAVRAASEVAGGDLSDFFRRYLSGKEPLPYETYFAYAGLRVEKRVDPSRAWFGGVTQRAEDGRARIANVLPGSPAETAGLERGDIVFGLDSRGVGFDEFNRAIESRRPGETVTLVVNRGGERKDITVALVADPYPTYTVRPVENPTELQRKILESWIGKK